MKVTIPFKSEFKQLMLSGQKTCTSRYKRYGYAGETFEAFGATFEISGVNRYRLSDVAELMYLAEGFSSPDQFLRMWWKLHPRRDRDMDAFVYTHWFSQQSNKPVETDVTL